MKKVPLNEYINSFLNIKRVIRSGYNSEEIIKYTKSEKIDLIMMGTHGRMDLDKTIFGSVADCAVKTSTVTVLLVNPNKIEYKSGFLNFEAD